MFLGKPKRVLKQCGPDAAIGEVWINKDGQDLAGNALAEADYVRCRFSDDDGSRADPAQVALCRTIGQPSLYDLG